MTDMSIADNKQNLQSTQNSQETHEELTEPSAVSTTKKEKFIPITRFALMDRIQKPDAWPEGMYQEGLLAVQNLATWRHQVYSKRLVELLKHYLPFSPDRDTVKILEYSENELYQKRKAFIGHLTTLVEQANYEEISEEELDAFFTAQGPYGLNLKVDMSEYDEALVYYRGSDTQELTKRDWKKLFIYKTTEHIPIFQRLFMLFKLKPEKVRIKEIMEEENVDEKKAAKLLKNYRKALPEGISSNHIYLKTFKNIPQSDLEMLFPNTKVEFKLFDKIKFIVTAGGGTLSGIIGTATKVIAATNPITLAIAFAGFCGLIFRQVSNFFNQRNRYMMVLAQNLYFHSLANNRGALTLLLDRAEEEDIKEEILLYTYLLHQDVPPLERVNAKENIEAFLNSEFGISIDYDFEDALERLIEDGLAVEDGNGILKAVDPGQVRQTLAQKWNSCLQDESLSFLDTNAA